MGIEAAPSPSVSMGVRRVSLQAAPLVSQVWYCLPGGELPALAPVLDNECPIFGLWMFPPQPDDLAAPEPR